MRVPWPISVLDASTARPRSVSSSAAFDASLHLAAAGESGAVEEEREADAAVGPGQRRALLGIAGRSRRPDAAPRARCSRCRSVWPVAVVSPGRSAFISRRRTGVQAQRLGDAVHVHLDGELRLRRAEVRGTRRWAACWSSSRGRAMRV